MAKAARKARGAEENTQTSGNDNGTAGRRGRRGDKESNSSFFRMIFLENPKLLKTRSNAEVLKRWLDAHPGQKSVPKKVKESLANVKSKLRKNLRKRKGRAVVAETPEAEVIEQAGATIVSDLEPLEIQIDECLTLAKNIDRQRLQDIIHLLRRARNLVVWKIGQ